MLIVNLKTMEVKSLRIFLVYDILLQSTEPYFDLADL